MAHIENEHSIMIVTKRHPDMQGDRTEQVPGVLCRAGWATRSVNYTGALSSNFLNMVGIGPFITIPLVIAAMGGPQALLGWVAGAFLCACDGLVWAELGSQLPHSGGPYYYLRGAFGYTRLGRLFGFLFLWQTLLIGPLSIASGAVGFSHYSSYLLPHASGLWLGVIAALVCLACTAMLYRDIRSVQWLSRIIGAIVIVSLVWIIGSGVFTFNPAMAFDFPAHAFSMTGSFWLGLGAASLISVYDYGGYNNVCMIAGDVRKPERTIPLVILSSILIVAVLYMCLNLAILGTVPWHQAVNSKIIVADFMEHVYGYWGGTIAVVLILIASLGSVFVMILAYSRVPYVAARAHQFFSPFRALHPKGHFPTVSLLYMGIFSAVASFMSLRSLIDALIVVQVMFQFLSQCAAVIVLRRRRGHTRKAFRMPLYPIPVIICVAGWIFIVATSKVGNIIAGALMIIIGVIAYLIWSRSRKSWPWPKELESG